MEDRTVLISESGFEDEKWKCMDTYQWVKRLGEDIFHVLDGTKFPNGIMTLTDLVFNLANYEDKDLESDVNGYYDDLAHLKEECGEDWKQVVAEILAEQTMEIPREFDSEKSFHQHVNKTYGIAIYDPNQTTGGINK